MLRQLQLQKSDIKGQGQIVSIFEVFFSRGIYENFWGCVERETEKSYVCLCYKSKIKDQGNTFVVFIFFFAMLLFCQLFSFVVFNIRV